MADVCLKIVLGGRCNPVFNSGFGSGTGNILVIDTLTSTSTKNALSANQGRLLLEMISQMGGIAIEIIKQLDANTLSDENVLSSLRTLLEIKNRAISKTDADTAAGLIKFIQGLEVGNYTAGMLGSGASLKMNNGVSELEVDKLTVRMIATFFELVISKISHIGGQLILSPARMKVTRVVDGGSYYRCHFSKGENGEVANEFVAGDQARCQVFNGSGAKMYWRLVTYADADADYIHLSKTDCVAGSAVPAVGDEIVQLGNRNDVERQNAIILSTVGSDAPSAKWYAGINSYSLENKSLTSITPRIGGSKFYGDITFHSNGRDINLSEWSEGVDNIAIGTRNLIQNGNFSRGNAWWDLLPSRNTVSGVTFVSIGYAWTFQKNAFIIKDNTEYCFSALIRNSNASDKVLRFSHGNIPYSSQLFTIPPQAWKRLSFTFTSGAGTKSDALNILNNSNDGTNIWITDIVLVEGNKPPINYIEAPEDVQARIDAENKRISDILNDNIADPSDKQYLKQRWDEIQEEYLIIGNEAEELGVSSYGDYEISYLNLENVLIPLFVDMTINSTIDGADIRLKFSEYYKWKATAERDMSIARVAPFTYLADKLTQAAITGLPTSVNGGLLLTSLIAVRNALGQIRGGFLGLDDVNLSLWGGSDLVQALQDIAGYLFKKDGSGHLAGGRVHWDSEGKFSIGEKTASEGIELTSDRIPTLANILNKGIVEVDNNIALGDTKTFTSVGQELVASIFYSKDFELEHKSKLLITVNSQVINQPNPSNQFASGFGTDGYIQLIRLSDNAVLKSGTVSGNLITFNESNATEFAKGKYRLVISHEGGATCTALGQSLDASAIGEIVIYPIVQKTVIGLDGIAMYDTNSDKYLRLSLQDTYLLEARGNIKIRSANGTYSFEINDTGIYINGVKQ